MTVGLVGSLLVAALTGLFALGSLRWRRLAIRQSPVLVTALALGIGLGLSSLAFFLWLLLIGRPGVLFPLVELGVVALLGALAVPAVARRSAGGRSVAEPPGPTTVPLLLGVAVGVTLAGALAAFGLQSAANPQGGWDAWMTWNMHARALYRGADRSLEVLAALPAWSHPDYPLLVPGSIARMWTYTGQETPLAPILVAGVFTFATAGLLYASVANLRSPTQGCLAALLLLGTKFFVLHGASQYADVPFGFFLLATLALLALSEVWPEDRPRLLAVAGLAAGLAAWTKNEGLLLLLALAVGFGLATVRSRGWRAGLADARALALGLLPVLGLVVVFKLRVAAGNDLMADQGLGQTVGRLLEGSRYTEVLAGVGHGFLDVTLQGALGALMVGYLVCAGLAPAGPWRPAARLAWVVVLLMLLGYLIVLLTAPTPLLATNVRSINRLLLQLWPSALLAFCLATRTAEEAGLFRPRSERADAVPGRSDRTVLPLPEAS